MFMIDPGAESYYSILGVAPDASVDEIRRAKTKLSEELRNKARQTNVKEEKERLEKREAVINDASNVLLRPADREKYDRENAHLRFFMIQPAAPLLYTTPVDRFYVLFRVLREFLAEQGVDLAAWTDTERMEFQADWTPTELLDSLLNQ
jgi:curved DNA-binding protein CbpA